MPTTDIAPFHLPGTDEYAQACASFQLAAAVDPAGAFTARTVAEVVQAVATARRAGLPLRVNTTGHGMGRTAPVTGSLLVRPLIDAPVRIDRQARTARIPAGKRWGDVLPETSRHGLVPLHGSSATVGVVGYLLGGGISFYGRRFGVAANTLRSITVVLADGEIVETCADHRPELFWALRGGGGGFGVVVEVQIDLQPMHRIITGMAVWDAAHAAVIAPAWQQWTRTALPEVTTSLRLLSVPPLPTVPPMLAGRHVLALDGAVAAVTEADLPRAEQIVDELLAPLAALAPAILNTWAPAAPETLPLTHMDPAEPIPFRSDTALLDNLTDDDWPVLLEAAGVGGRTSLLSVELRQLGGAFADTPPNAGALGALTAPLLYWSCGLPGVETDQDLSRVRDALDLRITGQTVPTFVDHAHQQQRTYGEATRHMVEEIRAKTDPDRLFVGDVAAIRDAA